LRYIRHHRRYRDIRLRLYPGEEAVTQAFPTPGGCETSLLFGRNLLLSQ
jgi:hypothetical protein